MNITTIVLLIIIIAKSNTVNQAPKLDRYSEWRWFGTLSINNEVNQEPKLDKYSGWRWLGALFSIILTVLIYYISYKVTGSENLGFILVFILSVVQSIGGALIFYYQIGGHIVYNLSYGAMYMGLIEILCVLFISVLPH